MTKEQALHSFWSQFGLKAYDENTVPDNAKLPYITYETQTGSFGDVISLSASLWYLGKSWKDITEKAEQINKKLGLGGNIISFDDGALWITRGTPFSKRMGDNNSSVRRIILNIQVEFISQ